jgi:hypothetical protein
VLYSSSTECRPTLAGADSAYRRSLYRRLLHLLVGSFSEAVSPTRRCGSAFPLVAVRIDAVLAKEVAREKGATNVTPPRAPSLGLECEIAQAMRQTQKLIGIDDTTPNHVPAQIHQWGIVLSFQNGHMVREGICVRETKSARVPALASVGQITNSQHCGRYHAPGSLNGN